MGMTNRESAALHDKAIEFHRRAHGKLEIHAKTPIHSNDELSLAYTPGVAEPCKVIHENPEAAYELTGKGNFVAIVTDGTAVLGLGDIGPQAALPVMEGKAVLFKSFAGVDAFPLCLNTKEVAKVVETVATLVPSFGGVNLEDISAPRCFEIEARLRREVDIPVFHDDQHGTAIITTAALLNALRVTDKSMADVRIVINGAGAAGMAIAYLLADMGAGHVVVCDRNGAIYAERSEGMNPYKAQMAARTNQEKQRGELSDVLRGADVFIGVSAPEMVSTDMVRTMNHDPIVFAMANPVPEIYPDEALAGGAAVVATGRSDFPNQINNSLVFPGLFRGALDVRAREVNEAMKQAAAHAIAALVPGSELTSENIVPSMWNPAVAPAVAAAVAGAAIEAGVARRPMDPGDVARHTRELVGRVTSATA